LAEISAARIKITVLATSRLLPAVYFLTCILCSPIAAECRLENKKIRRQEDSFCKYFLRYTFHTCTELALTQKQRIKITEREEK
jgi:hypothetical protein